MSLRSRSTPPATPSRFALSASAGGVLSRLPPAWEKARATSADASRIREQASHFFKASLHPGESLKSYFTALTDSVAKNILATITRGWKIDMTSIYGVVRKALPDYPDRYS
jgi:hypothetical protein